VCAGAREKRCEVIWRRGGGAAPAARGAQRCPRHQHRHADTCATLHCSVRRRWKRLHTSPATAVRRGAQQEAPAAHFARRVRRVPAERQGACLLSRRRRRRCFARSLPLPRRCQRTRLRHAGRRAHLAGDRPPPLLLPCDVRECRGVQRRRVLGPSLASPPSARGLHSTLASPPCPARLLRSLPAPSPARPASPPSPPFAAASTT
jgi:hypothetical protein